MPQTDACLCTSSRACVLCFRLLMELSSLRKRLARFIDLQSQQVSPSVRASAAEVYGSSPARASSPATPATLRRRELSPAPTPEGGSATLPLSPVPTPVGTKQPKRGGLFLSESRPQEDTSAALLALMGTSVPFGGGEELVSSAAWARSIGGAGMQSTAASAERGVSGRKQQVRVIASESFKQHPACCRIAPSRVRLRTPERDEEL